MANKILIVDDEPGILLMITARFQKSGYQVATATNGEEALQKVKQDRPDLVILDVMMPILNGYQVCRTLKDDPEFKKIPVILLTAKTTESDEFWGLEAGADAYVPKPYNAQELLDKVKLLLTQPK
jgi:DNA-binding response OmpR family regulator